jgi:hypothetical protein
MTDAEIERIRLSQMLRLYAVSREMEAARTGDARFIAAADCLRRMAGTLDQVSDDVLAKLASVNQLSEGLLSKLIAARVETDRRRVATLCRCGIVLPANLGDAGSDTAQRAPAAHRLGRQFFWTNPPNRGLDVRC